MVDNLKDKRLAKALKAIDSAIYGGNFSEKTMESVNIMVEIANAAYQTERRKIKLERKKNEIWPLLFLAKTKNNLDIWLGKSLFSIFDSFTFNHYPHFLLD